MIDILLVVRADVALAIRDALQARWNVSNYIKATALRRSSDGAGAPRSHFAAHGRIPTGTFGDLRDVLISETNGVRDSADWQAKQSGGSVASATWAIAYEGSDIVAAYRITRDNNSRQASPVSLLEAFGLVLKSFDSEGLV